MTKVHGVRIIPKKTAPPPQPRSVKKDGSVGGVVGRPRKDINWGEIERMARIHCSVEEITAVLQISKETLFNKVGENGERFKDVYKAGWDAGKESLRRKQWDMALAGDKTMLIWLGKQELNQSERWSGALGGDRNGVPIALESNTKPDLSKLSLQELMTLRGLVGKTQPVVDKSDGKAQDKPAVN